MARYGWGVGVFIVLVALGDMAFGQQGPARAGGGGGSSGVTVNIEPCVELDLAAVERLSALEFPSSSSLTAHQGQTQVNVGCTSSTVVVVVNVPPEMTLTRQLDLWSEPPEARERLLALLIGEAVAAALARRTAGPGIGQGADDDRESVAGDSLEAWLDDSMPYPEIQRRRSSPLGWLELALDIGVSARDFRVPIDASCDTSNRLSVAMRTGAFPEIGAHLVFYPGGIFTDRWASNLGLELDFRHHLVLTVLNTRQNQEVESEEYSISGGVTYRAALGTRERGVTIQPRIGGGRYSFFLGDVGNDVVPPFSYDHIYLGLNLYVPMATRHIGLDLGGSYLAVFSIGQEATIAYNASGQLPTTRGFDFNAGLSGQVVAGLRWGLNLELMGFYSQHRGKGRGYGSEPTTLCESSDCVMTTRCIDASGVPVVGGIATTDTARDLIWRLMLTISYRFGWDPWY